MQGLEILLLVKGILIGLSVAAPVGPISILCIRRTLTGGLALGLASGLGAATAHLSYASVAALGLSMLANILLELRPALLLLGGLFLCYLGWKGMRARPRSMDNQQPEPNLWSAYGSTVVLALTNPMTILSFLALFTGSGLVENSTALAALGVAVGVFLGSALWWLVLTTGFSLIRSRLTPDRMCWVNRFSGVMLVGFGLLTMSRLVL
jgi:threonine/homoserine/homoserine lactone efflux protein